MGKKRKSTRSCEKLVQKRVGGVVFYMDSQTAEAAELLEQALDNARRRGYDKGYALGFLHGWAAQKRERGYAVPEDALPKQIGDTVTLEYRGSMSSAGEMRLGEILDNAWLTACDEGYWAGFYAGYGTNEPLQAK